jgi:hypothetical protein
MQCSVPFKNLDFKIIIQSQRKNEFKNGVKPNSPKITQPKKAGQRNKILILTNAIS